MFSIWALKVVKIFAEHTLLEEIILNEARLGRSPTISGTLHNTNFNNNINNF